MKLWLEIIYERKQSTKQRRLGFSGKQSVLIKKEVQALLFKHQTGCLKNEAQVLVLKRFE